MLNLLGIQCDATNPEAVRRTADAVLKAWGCSRTDWKMLHEQAELVKLADAKARMT